FTPRLHRLLRTAAHGVGIGVGKDLVPETGLRLRRDLLDRVAGIAAHYDRWPPAIVEKTVGASLRRATSSTSRTLARSARGVSAVSCASKTARRVSLMETAPSPSFGPARPGSIFHIAPLPSSVPLAASPARAEPLERRMQPT